MVTVHGRTRCQFYQGKADWRAIARIKQAVSIPVVANGDVCSSSDAATILEHSGADAVMIGRAHYGAPWTGRQHRRGRCAAMPASASPEARKRWPTTSSPTTRTCCRSTASKAACARRASISAGISTATRRHSPLIGARPILTSLEPAHVIAALRDVFSSAAEVATCGAPHERQRPPQSTDMANAAQIVLNTIRRPVIMVDPDGFISLRQCRCRGFLPLQRHDPCAQHACQADARSAARC